MTIPAGLADCQWQEPGGSAAAVTIAAFLSKIGLRLTVEPLGGPGFLTGLAVRGGGIVIDPEAPAWPGDLLHEAGHIAVTAPALRPGMDAVSADPGEEMAAIAWSVAAARACGIALDVLFHPFGYKGDSEWLRTGFAEGAPFGLPLLQWYGMTTAQAWPAMSHWMRQTAP